MPLRLFFAIQLPDAVRAACERVQADLRATLGDDGIRWTAPPQFHFTLKFLGETPETHVPDVVAAAHEAAVQSSAFTLTIADIGALPSARSPQVLYLGVEQSIDVAHVVYPDMEDAVGWLFQAFRFPGLGLLAECLDRRLSERGFSPESRLFHPHLTLARVKSPAGFKAVRRWAAAELEGFLLENDIGQLFSFDSMKMVDEIGVFEVQQFVLVSSELHRDGPIYTVLETFSLIAT